MLPFVGGNHLFRKVTIVGVGLIGGSLGMALKKHKLAREVVGLSQKHTSLVTALKNQAIDHASHDMRKAVNNADLVILSTPVSIITNILSTIGPALKRNCIITDVGSAKAAIVNVAQKSLPPHVYFVGSHPLAGSEKRGSEFANPDLFLNSLCIMTPTEQTNKMAADKVKEMWTKIGAKVSTMTPDEHDQILACISHLPHLAAFGLMNSIPQNYLEYAAQGLKDSTRIAASSPQMWADICIANKKNIVTVLDDMVKNLSVMRKSIISGDQDALVNHFKEAKAKRDAIT